MAQAEANNSVIAFEVPASATQTAMNAALLALSAASFAQGLHKADGKEASKAVAAAERQAAWAAFDVVAEIEDKDEATKQGDALGFAIAKARDVSEKSFAVYRQRGRDLVTYKAEVASAGQSRTIAKGARQGETVNGRDEASPFAVVQRLRKTASENAAKKSAQAPFVAKARALVADANGLTADELIDALSTPGDEAMAYAVMIEDQIGALMSNATILDDFRAMLQRLADQAPEVIAAAWADAQVLQPKPEEA